MDYLQTHPKLYEEIMGKVDIRKAYGIEPDDHIDMLNTFDDPSDIPLSTVVEDQLGLKITDPSTFATYWVPPQSTSKDEKGQFYAGGEMENVWYTIHGTFIVIITKSAEISKENHFF